MPNRLPLTPAEREHIYRAKLRGCTLPEIAAELNCSVETVRKWWRVAREQGRSALAITVRGRRPTGILSHFAPTVIAHALALKRTNPRWGPNRVLVELQQAPSLHALALPSRSRLALLFKTECPECVGLRPAKEAPSTPPPRAAAVHECWQLDMQEGIRLADGRVATICSIRDVLGAAILASQAFDVTTRGRYRKLNWQEVRQVIRSAATEWETLPDSIQTDNEVCLAGQPRDPAPSHLTLWLIGLGVVHRFSRAGQPTDQAQIERTHRTLDNFAHLLDRPPDLASVQQRLDLEREQYNHWFPSRASDCGGRPPLKAHPELLKPRRPYRVEWERQLFDQQRLYDYLATIRLERKVSQVGQIQLGGRSLGIGRTYARQTVRVGCDPLARQWVVSTDGGTVVARLPIQGVDLTTLSGLPDELLIEAAPIQLTLPCLVA
jgi:transposase InsO family protein